MRQQTWICIALRCLATAHVPAHTDGAASRLREVKAARNLPPEGLAGNHQAVRMIPVFSSIVVIILGLAITAASAGWIQPLRFLS